MFSEIRAKFKGECEPCSEVYRVQYTSLCYVEQKQRKSNCQCDIVFVIEFKVFVVENTH